MEETCIQPPTVPWIYTCRSLYLLVREACIVSYLIWLKLRERGYDSAFAECLVSSAFIWYDKMPCFRDHKCWKPISERYQCLQSIHMKRKLLQELRLCKQAELFHVPGLALIVWLRWTVQLLGVYFLSWKRRTLADSELNNLSRYMVSTQWLVISHRCSTQLSGIEEQITSVHS